MGDDAAHRDDGAFKLLEYRRVPRAADDVDLPGELLHHAGHADEAFSRPQGAQHIADFRKLAFDSRNRSFIEADAAAFARALAYRGYFVLKCLDHAPRPGRSQDPTDFGEIIAKYING